MELPTQQKLPDKNSLERIAILGPTLSGKTTLAKAISQEFYRKRGIRSLILDINDDEINWGPQAKIYTDPDEFWKVIWETRGFLIIIDESTETIDRAKNLRSVFTRMRHQYHSLMVIGHEGGSMLPIMRKQITSVYLFRQPEGGADMWCKQLCDRRLEESEGLQQYEFIYLKMFGTPIKSKLPPPKNVSEKTL